MVGWTRTWERRCAAGATGCRPSTSGGPSAPVRRAAGLRREELAELAGLSVDYLVRLEQGRATSPSAQVVASLARALQLDPLERDHAYRLAGLLPPRGIISTHIPAGIQRMLARLGDLPVGVFSADWTLLSWTPAWAALLGDPSAGTPAQRNLARAVFTPGPNGLSAWPVLNDGDALSRALVADLRAALVDHPDDRGLADLVADLRGNSTEFAGLWDEGAVGLHPSARKTDRAPRGRRGDPGLRRPHRPRLRRPARRLHRGRGFPRRGEAGVPPRHRSERDHRDAGLGEAAQVEVPGVFADAGDHVVVVAGALQVGDDRAARVDGHHPGRAGRCRLQGQR